MNFSIDVTAQILTLLNATLSEAPGEACKTLIENNSYQETDETPERKAGGEPAHNEVTFFVYHLKERL